MINLAQRLAASEIAYIDHPEFRRRNAEKWLESQRPQVTHRAEQRTVSGTSGMAFIAGLVQVPLLTPAQERYLFLRMNFLKSQAEKWRRQIDVAEPDADRIEKVVAALHEATRIRNQIAEANLRLVVAVAKKLSASLDQLSELTSEGLLPLMRAVDLFDVHRGNRFSTYATWAVRNQMHRSLKRSRGVAALSEGEEDAGWSGIADRRPSATAGLQAQEQQQQFLTELIEKLDDRERRIISARFGLDGEPAGQSLAEISAQLGLSKERVRQIVVQSIGKLRKAVDEAALELPEIWGLGDAGSRE